MLPVLLVTQGGAGCSEPHHVCEACFFILGDRQLREIDLDQCHGTSDRYIEFGNGWYCRKMIPLVLIFVSGAIQSTL